ncbi:MAG TPA: tetratricopeptide repeat protein [Bryobacteraceae bacterium]|jgi:Flp pilus assembly protein TadD|nr:tetratricopeptide repeat protein [Bryobacteraceae bacterium]
MKKRRAAVSAASKAAPAPAPASAVPAKLLALICLLLAAAVVAIYAQTAGHGYVAYDDDQYVYQNHWVKAGLTAANIAWAFTTFFYANWHPLTWLSYMLDFSLWGENPGAQHLVNVAFHLGSALLLFVALARMTRRPWRAALVAALFALHPLRVESVAWISERKDVLSTFFQMLTLFLYVRYVAKPALTRYLAVAAVFALSLLAKPMAVTFPLVLLLVDYWPLQRFSWPPERRAARQAILEKLPLLALSAVASIFTFLAQRTYGAVASLAYLPFSARAANAAIAYVVYIAKSLWPADLAVLYPEHNPDASSAFLAALVLAAVTVLAWVWRRKRPYLAVGWLWYLGMLVPVIGLVQVGVQSMADRYTYMPTIGLSLALVWAVADVVEGRRPLRLTAGIAAAVALVALSAISFRQTEYWKSSRTLFEHTLAVTRDNHIIENNLGVVLGREGDSKGAVDLYKEALALVPNYAEANSNLAHELLKAGQFAEAEPYLTKALAENPNLATAHGDLGVLLAARGQFEDARQQFLRALSLSPEDADNESNLCFALTHLGRPQEAIAHCDAALRIDPNHANAKFNLRNARAALK